MKLRVLIAPLLVVAVFIAGCGSSSEANSESSSAATGAAGFVKPGQENGIAEFGVEASDAERKAASAILEQNLAARAGGNYALQCSSLTESVKQSLANRTKGAVAGKGCGKELAAEATRAPKSVLVNTLTGPIDALRVKGSKAYALYHGSGGKDYAMEMRKEDGVWYVASLVTREIP